MDAHNPMDDVKRRCSAKSKRSGQRCRRAPAVGQATCAMHGAKAPQTIAAARRRLEALAEPAVDALRDALKAGDIPASVRAGVAILDRCGMRPQDRPVPVSLPAVKVPADVLAALGALLAALADGTLTPSEAATVAGVVETHRRAFETVELERRIAALEEK